MRNLFVSMLVFEAAMGPSLADAVIRLGGAGYLSVSANSAALGTAKWQSVANIPPRATANKQLYRLLTSDHSLN